jgi:predicted RNase H-like HicB family nuclease
MIQACKVVIERDTQGGYVATFPELLGCQAHARSLKTLMERIREAVALDLEEDERVTACHSEMPQPAPEA